MPTIKTQLIAMQEKIMTSIWLGRRKKKKIPRKTECAGTVIAES